MGRLLSPGGGSDLWFLQDEYQIDTSGMVALPILIDLRFSIAGGIKMIDELQKWKPAVLGIQDLNANAIQCSVSSRAYEIGCWFLVSNGAT